MNQTPPSPTRGNKAEKPCARVFRDPVHFLALGFGSGCAPKAPGTFGTLAAIPLYLLAQPLPLWAYLLLTDRFRAGHLDLRPRRARSRRPRSSRHRLGRSGRLFRHHDRRAAGLAVDRDRLRPVSAVRYSQTVADPAGRSSHRRRFRHHVRRPAGGRLRLAGVAGAG
jgi:hypothetical protein